MNAYTIIISDQNTPAERELTSALQESPEISTPYRLYHLSEVGNLREVIRAEPAIGVLYLVDTWQEAVAIHDVVKTAAYISAEDTLIEVMASNATDDEALHVPIALFETWTTEWLGGAGTIVQDEGELYRSIHNVMNSGQNTKPSKTPSMWTRIAHPSEEYPEWIQPIGAHDAYLADAKVKHKGKNWINSHGNGNIWEPGVFGWVEVAE